MKASAVLITTNTMGARYELLQQAAASVVRARSDFIDELIMCVDVLPQNDNTLEPFARFKAEGWRVIFGKGGSRRGMVMNQLRGIEAAKNDWLFTVEDDVVIDKIPTVAQVEDIVRHGFGFICYNTHIHDRIGDVQTTYTADRSNYVMIGSDVLLRKDPVIADKWLITFPVSIVQRETLKHMHEYAMQHAQGQPIEVGLSLAWKLSTAWKEASSSEIGIYLTGNVLNDLPVHPSELPDYAQLRYWSNDPTLRHPSINGKAHIWY